MIKKRKLPLAATALAAILTVGGITPYTVHAIDPTVGSMDSDSDITFIENNSTTDPFNPEDPDKGGKPDPDKGGTNGPLSIDYVSDFSFGSNIKPLSRKNIYELAVPQKWDDEGTTTDIPCYAQVTDSRDTKSGWQLKVRQDSLFTHTETDDTDPAYGATLTGTTLRMKNAGLKRPYDDGTAAATHNDIEITTVGQQVNAMTAASGAGGGTSILHFGTVADDNLLSSISLEVPGQNAYEGKYTTVLTWSLEVAP